MTTQLPIQLDHLPDRLPLDGAIRIELVENIPIFRASSQVQTRIEALLDKQRQIALNADERQELDHYLGLVNRTIRNLYWTTNPYSRRHIN